MTNFTDQPIQTLLELVQQHKLDPWDIDIEKLTWLYIQRVREIVEIDLRASGRVLLTSSVLLRIKSDHVLNGHAKKTDGEELEEMLDLDLPDLGQIHIIQSTPRKITLEDLLGALKEALSEVPERKPVVKNKIEKVVHTVDEYEINILKHMAILHRRILELMESGKSLTFSALIGEKTRVAIARILLLLLYLCAEGKISLEQPEMFGEIYISVPKQGAKDGN
ncbi:MAG: segregation/condensation protein A [Candidatus Hadarchaeum sp.]|uniref:segregation/condensation protein A n=1 Tax=Candidatus Hadarchaeum sp. TaxID=2883567 RepID=UPI003D1360AC